MLEGVPYNTHCDWLIVGAIFPYYMYACGYVQVMFPNAWPPGKRQTENVTTILFLTCSGLYLETMALNHTCTTQK